MIRKSVAEILDQHVTFELEAIDRMYLNGFPSVPGPIREQRVCLVNDGIRGDQIPSLLLSLLEQVAGLPVKGILRNEMSKEAAAIDEDALHRLSAYASPRCLYLSVDTSGKSEWNRPASFTRLETASRRDGPIDSSRPPCSASIRRRRSPSERRRAACKGSSTVCITILDRSNIRRHSLAFL
jgi:hypothetical protein